MPHDTQLNLENFAGSPYADELRNGVSSLPFAPAIEAEYLQEYLGRMRMRLRAWYTLSAFIAVGFALGQARMEGILARSTIIHLGLLVPCALFMVFLVWSRHYDRLFMRAAHIFVPFYVASAAVIVAIGVHLGREEELASLVFQIFALFFLSGLMSRAALVASAIMVVAFATAAWSYHLPPSIAGNGLLLMVLTSGIAAVVCRDAETSYRRQFLEGILIRQLAARDGLTGVMNRRAFDEHLLRVWQQALRDKRPIALLLIDIDHFKAYNDTHGHQAGDGALRTVARTVQDFARRPLDLAARYGGEEFVVILYDLALPQLQLIAEKLRQSIEDLGIEHRAPAVAGVVTVSIGVGIMEPALDRTPQGAVQFADEALYVAKEKGRNRIFVRGGEDYEAFETGTFNVPHRERLRG